MSIFKAGFSLQDDYGRVTVRSFQFEAADITAAIALAAQFATAYQAVSELHLFETRLIDEVAIGGSPVSGANVDEGMSITAQLATANKKASIQIPSPVAAVLNSDGTVDLADALMVALLGVYTQATNYVTASDGEQVTGFIKGTLDK